MVQPHEAPPVPPSTPRQERALSAGPAIYVCTGSAAPIGCEDRRLPLAAFSSIAATGWLGFLPVHTVRLRRSEAELQRCWKQTSDGGREGSLGNGEGGSGGGWAPVANGRALSAPCGGGGHDTELLGAGLHCPRQRAEPGARHLLPPVPGGRRAAPRVDPRREPRGPAEPPGLATRSRRHPLLAALCRSRLRALRAAAEAAAGSRALPLPTPGAAARRPEEQSPRPSPEAAAPQPLRGGPQLQPEGAAAAGRLATAAAPGGREVPPHPPAQNGAERPVAAGGKAAPVRGNHLPCELHSWKQMAEYSPEMRQFACILHLYHIKAYNYLRKILPLPHPCSLTNWLSTNKAAAGFSDNIFLCLQEKVERGEQDYHYCALMVQDMPLQKQWEWDPQTQCLTGFVDLGAGILDADEAPLASEAIIIMAVGISSPWVAPLGYFFVNSTTGYLLAQLLRQAINKLNNIGIRVLAVTSGATACGAQTARALGIRMDPERIQCTFQHPPGSAHSITYFFDICHALQLIRNALQCFQKIEWLGDTVRWQHVVELAALREQRVLELCSSKSGRSGSKGIYHLKVNLATQLFSEGVADALEHLQKLGLASFQNCNGTVKFVRLMSHLCDVFHGRGPYRMGLMGPLLVGNYTKITHLFNEAKSFFITFTDSMGRYIIKSKRKLGFLSFLLNAESLKWLYTNYVSPESTSSHHFLTYAFSLDPLELFLRTLQQACGNGNPTCTVFQAAYHKLLAGCNLAPGSPYSSGLGSMSSWDIAMSRRRDLTLGSIRAQYNPAHGRTLATEYLYCAGLLLRGSALSNALTDLSLHVQSITCTAGFIAEQLASDLQCDVCVASLFESDKSRLRCRSVLYIKKLGGVSLPSASVYRITSISEQVLNWYCKVGDSNNTTKLWHLSLEQKIFQELLGETPLFPALTNHLFHGEACINNHYTTLVKEITRCYLKVKKNYAKHLELKYHYGRHKLKTVK